MSVFARGILGVQEGVRAGALAVSVLFGSRSAWYIVRAEAIRNKCSFLGQKVDSCYSCISQSVLAERKL